MNIGNCLVTFLGFMMLALHLGSAMSAFNENVQYSDRAEMCGVVSQTH